MKEDECDKATAELEAWKLQQKQIAAEEAQLKLQRQKTNQDNMKTIKKAHEHSSSNGSEVKHGE